MRYIEMPDGSVGRIQPVVVVSRKKSSLVASCPWCDLKVRVYLMGRGGVKGPFALGKKFTPLDSDGAFPCEGCGTVNILNEMAV